MSLVFYILKQMKEAHSKMRGTSESEKNSNSRKGDNKNEGSHHSSQTLKLDASKNASPTTSTT